jgi:hypothetical protein
MTAITRERWELAQQYEAAYWAGEAKNPDKLARDIAEGHHFTAGVLDIRRETVVGPVLDIAGGPYPLGARLGWFEYAVIDPAVYPEDGITRIHVCAEDYSAQRFGRYDEVWGYNVLQHVQDPAAVMAVARVAALHTIRWFDVVDTPIYPVHPHSIKADWLRAELTKDGFHLTRDIDGSRLVEGHRQKWVALVAVRA